MSSTARNLTVGQTDLLAMKVLEHCQRAGLVADVATVEWPAFHRLRARLYETFDVPDSSLTPLAARVLWGLSACHQPRTIAVLGCYVGNLMAWVTGPGFGPDPRYAGECAIGLDVDPAAIETASGNFHRAGFAPELAVRTADAFDAGTAAPRTPCDLLLVDIDVPGARKSGYARLVQAWSEFLAPGALVIAHDVCHPVFAMDLGDFGVYMRLSGATASITLPIDDCGLEVSRWAGASDGSMSSQ